MAAARDLRCCQRSRPEKLGAWPGPASSSASRMEVLAREDIDQAVHMILFRENHVVKRLDAYLQHLDAFKKRRKEMLYKKWVQDVAEPLQQRIREKVTSCRGVDKTKQENFEYYLKHGSKMVTVPPFAGPLFRRQQEADKEKKSGPQDGTGRRYSTKEFKETEKTSPCARVPQFPFPGHSQPPREWRKTGPRFLRPRTHSAYSPENLTCAEKKHSPGEETSDLSQMVFERQFRSSRLGRALTGAAKVLGAQQQRPRSWAAGDHRQRRGPPPVERRAMTAEVLGKHLVSLQEVARSPSIFYCSQLQSAKSYNN
ncbi:PREDICTED: protein FAM228A isoform X6 [Chinchilla lanigera]|uniref:Protein FAM228B n=1 Tax=Chinchilla lanigera TaxID=34839 RepID=A0A8C2V6N6_CHILA|nr:PREDICTED: protein FAM228A isoform X6 [Chinchilla lanigera]